MATLSQGIVVTWGGTAFTEVVDLQASYGGSSPKGRSAIWSDEAGSVSVVCLGAVNVSNAMYGTRNDIAISGGGISLTCKAIYEGWSASPEVNGVTRYSVNFRLLDG